MPVINVTDRQGRTKSIEGQSGLTIMEIIRDDGFGDLLALCGGGLSCATCHVYVDPAYATVLVPMEEGEDELLDSTGSRTPESRLSCQIRFTNAIDGLMVTVAPED